VAMHWPPHGVGVIGQTIVGVQVEPVGQGPLLPTVQGITGGNVGVAMHWPPHGVGVIGQTIVGVQVEPVGQGPLLPTEQGITGGIVGMTKHCPRQVSVWVQVAPVGQGSPPNVQVTVNTGGAEVRCKPRASGIIANSSASFILKSRGQIPIVITVDFRNFEIAVDQGRFKRSICLPKRGC
jgi:hypothetical protein